MEGSRRRWSIFNRIHTVWLILYESANSYLLTTNLSCNQMYAASLAPVFYLSPELWLNEHQHNTFHALFLIHKVTGSHVLFLPDVDITWRIYCKQLDIRLYIVVNKSIWGENAFYKCLVMHLIIINFSNFISAEHKRNIFGRGS